jgi:hypothetical protein
LPGDHGSQALPSQAMGDSVLLTPLFISMTEGGGRGWGGGYIAVLYSSLIISTGAGVLCMGGINGRE